MILIEKSWEISRNVALEGDPWFSARCLQYLDMVFSFNCLTRNGCFIWNLVRVRQLRKQREQFRCMRCKGSKASSATFGSQLNVSNSLKFHFWSSFPPGEGQVSQRKTISLQLTSTSCGRIRMLCVARVAKSKPPISSVNTPITGLPFCSKPKRLQRALCRRQAVFDFLSHTWFVSQPHMTMAAAATSCTKAEVAEGVKREPTDPHKQALSFMASVTPSLLKPDSQTFKHHWRALLFSFSPLPTPSHSFSHTIHSLQRSSFLYPPRHLHPVTPRTRNHSTHNTSVYTLYTHTPGRGRGGQHNSSLKNAGEVYVAIGKGERHLVWAQMSNYPFQRAFPGNVPPTSVPPGSRRNTATFSLSG